MAMFVTWPKVAEILKPFVRFLVCVIPLFKRAWFGVLVRTWWSPWGVLGGWAHWVRDRCILKNWTRKSER